MSFDFDQPVDRAGTHTVKYDERDAKFGRADVTPMWIADMDLPTAPCVAEALATRAAHPLYGYTVVPESLYRTIMQWHADRHGWSIGRDRLVLAPGTLPAMAVLVQALSEPGDGVVIQPPVYGGFTEVLEGSGRRIVANPLRESGGRYTMDLDHLERCVAEGARLLLLCNPHNPVGQVWDRDTLEAVLELTRRHDFAVIADNIHGDLAFDGIRFTPIGALAREGDHVISLVSPAKTFNTQGLAFCAMVIPDAEQRDIVASALAAAHLTHADPFTLAAAEAAWRDGGPWRDELVAYLQQTRDEAVAFINDRCAPIRVVAPEAGYLMWLDCRDLNLSDDELARFFIDRCGLGLNPGTGYGAGGEGFMRLNFAAPRERVMRALESIAVALA